MISNNFNVSGSFFRPNPGTTHFQSRAQGINVADFLAGNMQFPGVNNAGTSQNFQNQILNMRSSAEALRTSIGNITNRNAQTPFNTSGIASANEEIMRITGSDANRLRNVNTSAMNVTVIQTAQYQQNEGREMNGLQSAVEAGFTAGNNRININIGNRNFNIDFNVRENDTVNDVQNRIADAINARSDLGVNAGVAAGEGQNTSRLILESAQTGERSAFTVTDAAGGNAAGLLQVTQATQDAQNAQFRVNRGNITGFLQTSETNNVSLGHGITAELRREGNTGLSPVRDELGQINAFRDFVNNFNSFMDNARSNTAGNTGVRPGRDLTNIGGADRLVRDLQNMVTANARELANIGITMNNEGRLSIDAARMDEAARSGELENFARNAGNVNGFLNRVSRTANNVANNPASVVAAPEQGGQGSNIFGGMGGMNMGNLNIAQFTRLSSMANLGMLFDSLF